ncbi:hypothetical protein D9757_010778 [Collybiopsis confluens]|uniref:Dynein heavy chain C-terminal domain-containing protein n=1 Tax=Collybiopsis confluens TaxID=2823264 RepID=A0A8H5M2T1_9AGAR|nr:hypothetical protein D9757_010778 [Collybiopsis confluens]
MAQLPPTAERVIAIAQGDELLGKLRKMRTQADDDDESAAATSKSQTSRQPAWMRQLFDRCKEWLALLPEKFNNIPVQSGENPDPLYRLFSREGVIGRRLLNQVRRDLSDTVRVFQGELKQTNHLRSLMSSLTKGTIPNHWRVYQVPKAMAVSGWVANFAKRLAQLDNIAGVDNLARCVKSQNTLNSFCILR